MNRDLSRALHALTARLDRGADRILRAEADLSYSRFLALYLIGELGADSQRALARQLGVTEPSASRMTGILSEAGHVTVTADPHGGRRHQLRLTGQGEELVGRCGALLERRLAELVTASGVDYERYLADSERLLAILESTGDRPASRREDADHA